MSPLFKHNTLKTRLEKKTKSLAIELIFHEGQEFFSPEMIFELEGLFNWLTAHLEIQTVIISSNTHYFSKGIDLQKYAQIDGSNLQKKLNSLFTRLRTLNKSMMFLPQIFIIDYAHGAKSSGFEFGIGADLRLAHTESTFSINQLDKGLIPMSGGMTLLKMQIGPSLSKKWNLLPEIPHSDLKNTGYITSFYQDEEKLNTLLSQLATYSPTARAQIKGCMLQSEIKKLDEDLDFESHYGLPLLMLEDWKKAATNNDSATTPSFRPINKMANHLTKQRKEKFETEQ